ncbi:MAG: hypothetical protein IJZ57_02435 [Clostridia bacterium]|nr:hypothetical protein [Clostridia bacterium]
MAKKRDDKNWSMDEVDRLLSRTEKAPQKEETVVENFARTMRLADTMVTTSVSAEEAARVESLDEDDTIVQSDYARIAKERADAAIGVVHADTGDIQISSKTAKQRVSDVLKGLKKAKLQQSEAEEKTVAIDFDEPLIPKKEHSMETDENRRKFLEVVEIEDDDDTSEHTRVVERPGFVKQKTVSEKTTDLDIVPTLIDAEDFINNIADEEPEEADVHDLWDEGQIRLVGFEDSEQKPEKVNEFEAEQNLKVKRREKIDKFKLMGIAEAEEESRATNGKLEKLFGEGSNDDKTDTSAVKTNCVGVEYTNIKDANRIRATLHKAKRLSAVRFGLFSFFTVVMLVINIVSKATVGFDATVSHSLNIVLLAVCIILGMNSINSGVIALLKKQPNLKSSVMLVSAFAVIQSVVSFALEEFLAVETFVISACAAFAFAIDEYGDYLRHARTYDAFNFCTGREKENLHSVQRVENKNDEFEIGRVLLMNKPDVRYSCKTNFPTKLISRCESEVSSDRLAVLLLPMTLAAGALCAILAGIFSKSLVSAVTSLAAAVCVCVPAFGTASIQLPLRWVNKRLNKAGGMISGQKAVEDFSKTNAIVIDSAELFDQQACRLHGIRDFKKVRIDDLTLYAAAMMVKSGGPLTAVFDQVVSKRDLLPNVSSFNYEERMGVSGWINGQKVIMGNRNMMKLHNMALPDISEEEKYTYDGRRVIYLAIANQLAAMMVVSYAPNKKLIPFIRRLGTDGVTVLLRNYDSNVTTDMINEIFGVRFNNIRLISNTSGRIYKKYRNRVRETSKSGILHDGKAFSLFRSFTMSYTLCGTFKVENLIQLINVIVGFAVIAVFSIFDVISITGAWPLLLVQGAMTAVAFLVARVRGIF